MTRSDRSERSDKDAVLAEHRALREILGRLRGARERAELGAVLAEFRAAAVSHFDGEEAPGGFYEHVQETAPRHLAVLDELRDEHGILLRETDRLVGELGSCAAGDLDQVRTAVLALVERLEQHEATENEILLEVMNQDLGAGD